MIKQLSLALHSYEVANSEWLVTFFLFFALWMYSKFRDKQTSSPYLANLPKLTSRTGRRLNWFAVVPAFGFVTIGLAGLQTKSSQRDGVAFGRDYILVLDQSRSMLAEDTVGPRRADAARALAQRFVSTLREPGGDRVAIVEFAAKPRLLVPLTTDFDHLEASLAAWDASFQHPLIQIDEQSRSGTDLAAALVYAVNHADRNFLKSHTILFLSDGDDPKEPRLAERELEQAITLTRQVGIPTITIGFGDPERASPVIIQEEFLEAVDETGLRSPVQTKLVERPLQRIAQQTGGTYFRAGRGAGPTNEELLGAISSQPRLLLSNNLRQQRDTIGLWFGLAALVLLVAWPSTR